jgi:hypothetical protein
MSRRFKRCSAGLGIAFCGLFLVAGCQPWVLPAANPTAPDLEGFWMSTENIAAYVDNGEEVPSGTNVDFWKITRSQRAEGLTTYQMTHPCSSDVLAYAYATDDGDVQIEPISGGASVHVSMVENTMMQADAPVDDGSWSAVKIEKPLCGAADASGKSIVTAAPIELVDTEQEVYPSDSGQAVPSTGNGLAHLTAAIGSRLRAGDEYTTAGQQSTNCSSGGSTVDCGPSGGHPGYVQCVDQEMSEGKMKALADVAVLGDTDQIYPGALLQGNHFDGGSFVPITIPRSGGTLTMSGLFGNAAQFSRTVANISNSTVSDTIISILSNNQIQGTAANASFRVDTAYSSKAWAFKLDTDVKFASADISAAVDTGNSKETNTVIMKFTQVFYTVSYQDPRLRTDVFADGIFFDDPENQIGTGNPPLYVSNVKYGRQVFFVASSSLGSNYVTAALKGAYNGAASVSVESGMSYKDIMKNTSVSYIVRGGDAGLALAPLKNASPDEMYDKIKDVLATRDAATWSAQNPGIPVAYTLRYLDDRTVAMKGLATTYDQRDCRTIAAQAYQYRLEVDDIDDDVYVWVDAETDAMRKYYTNARSMRADLNPWIPADNRDHTIIIKLGNGGCYGTSGTFRVYRDGALWSSYYYNPGGWQDCGWQVDLRYLMNPSTGAFQLTQLWHAH